MRSTAGARGRVAALAVVAAVLAGCSGGGDAGDGPSGGAAGSPERAGRPLGSGAARGALLHATDLPPKWRLALASARKASVRTDPPACAGLLTALTAPEHHARAVMNYASSTGEQSLEETITSFKENAAPLLEPLPSVLTGCRTFTRPDAGGTTSAFVAEPLSFPALGERTFAVRFTVTSGTSGSASQLKLVVDTVYVAVGHNGVAFVAGGLQPLPSADLEAVVRKGMARLAA